MPTKPKRKVYIYGSITNHRQLKGEERSDTLMEMSSTIHLHKEYAKKFGTRIEKLHLSYISDVEVKELWVRVHFINATPVSVKEWVKKWLVSNKYLFSDKKYGWTDTIVRSTKCISLGPWSIKPRAQTSASTYTRFSILKSC